MSPLPHVPWYTAPEWWLVIAAVLTLLAIIYQAREMAHATKGMRESTKEVKRQADILERQTAATEAAAKAALLNAKAVIAAERPWIVVAPQKSSIGAFAFKVMNKGRTPAQLKAVTFGWTFDSYHDSSRMAPTYGTKFYAPRNLMEPDGEFDIVVKEHPDAMVDRAGLKERIRIGNQFLIFDGKVTYSDALGGEGNEPVLHETVWCYYFDFASRDFIRIEEYNRYT
jgi:hypothetical protein